MAHARLVRIVKASLTLAAALWGFCINEFAMAERRLVRERGKEITATIDIAGSRWVGHALYSFHPAEGGERTGTGYFSGAALRPVGASVPVLYLPEDPDRNFALDSDPPYSLWWRALFWVALPLTLVRLAMACLSDGKRAAMRPKMPRWLAGCCSTGDEQGRRTGIVAHSMRYLGDFKSGTRKQLKCGNATLLLYVM